MPSTFFDRIDELKKQVGEGTLEGTVTNGKVYAAPQETGTWLTGPNAGKIIRNHPGGGGTHFLSGSLLGNSSAAMEEVAKTVLEPGGPEVGMKEAVDLVAAGAAERAPFETGALMEDFDTSVEG